MYQIGYNHQVIDVTYNGSECDNNLAPLPPQISSRRAYGCL